MGAEHRECDPGCERAKCLNPVGYAQWRADCLKKTTIGSKVGCGKKGTKSNNRPGPEVRGGHLILLGLSPLCGCDPSAVPKTGPTMGLWGAFNARPKLTDAGINHIRRLVAARIPELSVDEIAAALAGLDPTTGALLEIADAIDDIVEAFGPRLDALEEACRAAGSDSVQAGCLLPAIALKPRLAIPAQPDRPWAF